MKTYNAKIKHMDPRPRNILRVFCEHAAYVERKLFQDRSIKGLNPNYLKRSYQRKYGINARHYNSIVDHLNGLEKNWQANEKNSILLYKKKTKHLVKKISFWKKDIKKKFGKERQRVKFILHQKKRKLEIYQAKLKHRELRYDKGIPHICFGGSKLFKAQFHLKENNFTSHQQWKEAFQFKRSSSIFFLGSKDEALGNSNCRYIHLTEDGKEERIGDRNCLRITLPQYIIDRFSLPSRYSFTVLVFQYGKLKLAMVYAHHSLEK